MLAHFPSATVVGVQAFPVEVEVDVGRGFAEGNAVVVGLPDAAVRESRDRVKSAIQNSGFQYPDGRITINLAPADLRKEGPLFDLPIALGILVASGQVRAGALTRFLFVGELALNGGLRPVRGVLPMAVMARDRKMDGLVVPTANAREAAVVHGLDVHPAGNLREVVDFLEGKKIPPPVRIAVDELLPVGGDALEADFSEVKGQESVKRAIEIAVSGGHNLLMIGPPGSGKSMLAKRIPGIMPPMSLEEALETTKIHSVVGLLPPGCALVGARPFRAPHHTISDIGLIGGSAQPTPGEVSLAHNGVLFLDELPEFKRSVLEVLRQPLEDGQVTISRAAGTLTFPSRFMFVAAMNPTPTGSAGDAVRGKVSAASVQRYLNRISGPLLDRIDMHLEVAALRHDHLIEGVPAETSASIRVRVVAARERQLARFREMRTGRPVWCNAQMGPKEIKTCVPLDAETKALLKHAMQELNLSARAYDRILKVARTIADLAGQDGVGPEAVSEAISYRSLDRQYWG